MSNSKELEAWFEDPGSSLFSWRSARRAERYASGLGGGLLIAFGLSRKTVGGALLAAMGAGLLLRGLKGMRGPEEGLRLLRLGRSEWVKVHRTITVLEDAGSLFERTRTLEGLSLPMRQVQFMGDAGGGSAKVIVRMPRGGHLEAAVRIDRHDDGRRVAWRTEPGAPMRHSGSLIFRPAPGDRGTEVHLVLEYELVPMSVGSWMTRLSRSGISRHLAESLRRYKQVVECGEIATLMGQPSGRRGLAGSRRLGARPRSAKALTVRERWEATP